MMKSIHRLLAFLLCLLALFLPHKPIFANNIEDNNVIELDEKELQRIIDALDPAIEDDDHGIEIGEISCFDINLDGRIAVGYVNKSSRAYISVYNEDYEFIKGYSIRIHGDYGIVWDGKNLVIYIVRGNYLVYLDDAGNVVAIKESNNSDYMMLKVFQAPTHETDGRLYRLENVNSFFDSFSSRYSMLSVYENGEKRILFDGGTTYQIKVIFAILSILSMVVVCILLILVRIKKNKDTIK